MSSFLTTRLLDWIAPEPETENVIWRIVRKRLRLPLSDVVLAGMFCLIFTSRILPVRVSVWVPTAVLLLVAGFPFYCAAALPRLVRPLGPALFAAPITGKELAQVYSLLHRASVPGWVTFCLAYWCGNLADILLVGAGMDRFSSTGIRGVLFFALTGLLFWGGGLHLFEQVQRWGWLALLAFCTTLLCIYWLSVLKLGWIGQVLGYLSFTIYSSVMERKKLSEDELLAIFRRRALEEAEDGQKTAGRVTLLSRILPDSCQCSVCQQSQRSFWRLRQCRPSAPE